METKVMVSLSWYVGVLLCLSETRLSLGIVLSRATSRQTQAAKRSDMILREVVEVESVDTNFSGICAGY